MFSRLLSATLSTSIRQFRRLSDISVVKLELELLQRQPFLEKQPYLDALISVCNDSSTQLEDVTKIKKEFNKELYKKTYNILEDYVSKLEKQQRIDFIVKHPNRVDVLSLHNSKRLSSNSFMNECGFDYDLINQLIITYGKDKTYQLLSQLSFYTDGCYRQHNLLYTLVRYDHGYCDKYFETIELLLDIGFDVNTSSPYDHITLLMYAAKCVDNDHGYKLAQIFLKRNSDINLKSIHGYTALDIAIGHKNDKVIELIMEYKNSAY